MMVSLIFRKKVHPAVVLKELTLPVGRSKTENLVAEMNFDSSSSL
jgi:hypothetical protein